MRFIIIERLRDLRLPLSGIVAPYEIDYEMIVYIIFGRNPEVQASPMTTGLTLLAFAVGLGFVHLVLVSHEASLQRGYRWSAGSRDEVRDPLTGIPARLERAQHNFNETFPFFSIAILIAHVAGKEDALAISGAYVYLGGRVAYLIAYASGVFLARSIIWNIATFGIFMIIFALR